MFSNWYLHRAVETRLFRRQTPKQTRQDQMAKQTESASSSPSSESLKATQESTEKSQDTRLSSNEAIITNDKVEKVGACFKHVVEECSKDCSAKELGLTSMPFLKDAVDMATSMVTLSILLLHSFFRTGQTSVCPRSDFSRSYGRSGFHEES